MTGDMGATLTRLVDWFAPVVLGVLDPDTLAHMHVQLLWDGQTAVRAATGTITVTVK